MSDVLRWPLIGTLGRHARTRLILQLALLAMAAAIVLHGLLGSQIAPRNLATVLTWVHYRGLLVVGVLAVGNLFCASCPMILTRDVARRAVHLRLRWPRWLRNKWPGIVLFVAVLFVYERFDLWSLPRATAWLVLAYFASALLVDVIFAGASFCKYLCPVGQFNFIASTMAPSQLQVRRLDTCRTCGTVDCIKGRDASATKSEATKHTKNTMFPATESTKNTKDQNSLRTGSKRLRGCELNLFLPAKVGNLDCTLCFDCVRACPHDNIALVTRLPGEELIVDERRSGIGRLTKRPDMAALVVVFTFGALLNAFAMTSPARAFERSLASMVGAASPTLALVVAFGLGLVVVPLVLIGGAALAARFLAGQQPSSMRDTALQYVFALVPLGFFIWTAHYAFHFLTGVLTVVPVLQSAVIDLTNRPLAGEPLWALTGLPPGSVYAIQLGCLLVGALGSIAVSYRISLRDRRPDPRLSSVPWAVTIIVIACAAGWTFSQPMEMRGVVFPG
jgi:ferredoxin